MDVPQFHTDRAALAEALAWCAQDARRWHLFTYALFGQIEVANCDFTQAALLAPPHVLAQALAAAIEGETTR